MKKVISFILLLTLSCILFQTQLYCQDDHKQAEKIINKLPIPQNDKIFRYLGFTDSNDLISHEEEINFYNEPVLDGIILNGTQTEKIKKMKMKTYEDLKGINKQLSDKYVLLENELSKNTLIDNSKTITDLQNQIHDLYVIKIKSMLSHKKQLREILTNKQYCRMLGNTKIYKNLKEELNLEQEQLDKVVMLFETAKQKSYSLKRNLYDTTLALNLELNKQNFDSQKVDTLNNKMLDLSKEMLKVAINAKIQLKKIISPDQYRTFYKDFPIFAE